MIDSPNDISNQQKACLRLVGRGHSSKEIALETGLSPLTVDTYVKAAMSKLGASNRRDAARILEAMETSQEFGSPSKRVGAPASDGHPEAVAGTGRWRDMLATPPLGGRPNDLSPRERTFAVLRVAVVGLAVIVAIALVLAGVLRMFS